MKKLLLLSSGSYNSPLTIRLRYLARHLATAWNVTVVVPSADKYNSFKPDRKLKPAFARLVQPWQPTTHSPMLNLIPYLFTALMAVLRARPDMVVIYKPTPITVLGLVPKLLFRVPVVLDLDDLGSEVMKREGQSRLACALVAWSERLCMHYANAVVVVSTALRDHVLHLHPDARVLLLPNGVEPSDYQEVVEQAPRPAIYYFGVLNQLDLVEGLLRAMPAVLGQVPEARLSIIGGGSALPGAKKLAHELGIDAAVSFPGWQTDMLAVQRYTQFADIAVCYQPDTRTVRAASIMKVYQYMAMRSALVVSDVGDLRSCVKDGQAGVVVPPADVPALAAALVGLLRDDSRRTSLARAAGQLADTEYSWQTRAEKLQAFMAELTQRSAS